MFFARHLDNTVVRPDNAENYRQTKASTGELGGKKRVENFIDSLVHNAAASVRYLQAGIELAFSTCQSMG